MLCIWTGKRRILDPSTELIERSEEDLGPCQLVKGFLDIPCQSSCIGACKFKHSKKEEALAKKQLPVESGQSLIFLDKLTQKD